MSITPIPPPAPPAPRRGHPILAWAVILAIVALILYRNAGSGAGGASTAWLIGMQAQARYLVGAASFGLPGATGPELYQQAGKMLDRTGYSQRLRFAIVGGELVGPDEAVEELTELEADRRAGKVEPQFPRSVEVVQILRKLYAGYQAGEEKPTGLPEEERQTLLDGLGWFGELALAHGGGDPTLRAQVIAAARRTVVGFFLIGAGAVIGLVVGGTLLVVLATLLYTGRLRGGLSTGGGHGGIYAETFALYMAVYVGLGYLSRFISLGQWQYALSGVAMLLSLLALAWPVLRGVSWRQVRQDVGLTAGDRPPLELLAGVGCYVAAIPVLLSGVLIMLGLAAVMKWLGFEDPLRAGHGPTHPIAGVALHGNWLIWLQVLILASVFAPLVEEIMFRGVLYRHLREATDRQRRWVSVVLSVLASSFLFAVIHPQGWMAVPALMGLAAVFALTREWRGSLVPPMVAHGINNGITLLMLLLVAA